MGHKTLNAQTALNVNCISTRVVHVAEKMGHRIGNAQTVLSAVLMHSKLFHVAEQI